MMISGIIEGLGGGGATLLFVALALCAAYKIYQKCRVGVGRLLVNLEDIEMQ